MSPPLAAISPADEEKARQNFLAWLRWYMQTHQDTAGDKKKLADLLGISRPSLSLLLNPRLRRAPSFATMLAATRVLGLPFETLTGRAPPK